MHELAFRASHNLLDLDESIRDGFTRMQITLIVILCVLAFPIFVWKVFLLMRKRRGAGEQTDSVRPWR